MFMDIYAVQNVPPSNINRDETGNPKTAQYGGVLRSRVSSQAWKRAMRETFKSLLEKKQLGVRTKNAVELIAKAMATNGLNRRTGLKTTLPWSCRPPALRSSLPLVQEQPVASRSLNI